MSEVLSNGMFGIALSVGAYEVGVLLNRKWKSPLLNPLLIGTVLVIVVLLVFRIPPESYSVGGDIITMFLTPATAVLAYSIYQQIAALKKYWLPILAGCLAGALTSVFSVFGLCKLFGLSEQLTASLLPKSVTTAIALDVSESLGGIPALTVVAVVITGTFGAVFAPLMVKLFRVKNPVAAGVAIGTCSHAAGTSRAIELGELQGAMSGISVGVAGLITVLITLFF
ncbi:MAG: LrgB family protein [Oscillospiraceae bacterium]|nr:LrgB family protein [Oscillospiraceae bacterium]